MYPVNNCPSWRRLEDVFNTSSAWRFFVFQDVFKMSWRRLQDFLEDEKLLSWRLLQDVLKTCLKDVLKTLWRQTKCLLGISVFYKSKCVSNKSIFHKSISDKSKANPKCINSNLIILIFAFFWNWSSISIFRIKTSDDCSVL